MTSHILFIKMVLMSENNTVCTISNMCRYRTYSIMGTSMKLLIINMVWMKEMCTRIGSACLKIMKM